MMFTHMSFSIYGMAWLARQWHRTLYLKRIYVVCQQQVDKFDLKNENIFKTFNALYALHGLGSCMTSSTALVML